MGHYTGSYEATQRTQQLQRKEDLLHSIADETIKMKTWELEVVYDVVQHTSEYAGMLSIFKRAADKDTV